MNPDYEKAALKAEETVSRFVTDLSCIDPLAILNTLPNVLLIAYGAAEDFSDNSLLLGESEDAFTLVNRKEGKLQYIVIYNQYIAKTQLRMLLARELGHVILEHDGNAPESVWLEEATCFAYHFLCPLRITHPTVREIRVSKKIHYRSKHTSKLWEMKGIEVFDSISDMREYVVFKKNQFNKTVGSNKTDYAPSDVHIFNRGANDIFGNWQNYSDVVVDGEVVGYCGE